MKDDQSLLYADTENDIDHSKSISVAYTPNNNKLQSKKDIVKKPLYKTLFCDKCNITLGNMVLS